MPASFRALCSDFYINQKLSVKLDLPRGRDSVLELFERVRKQFGSMQTFRRYREELALESPQDDQPHRWLAVRSNNIRSGAVNPREFDEAYGLHRLVLETAPYFLSISALDIDYLELLYGFDLLAGGDHDRIVASALLRDSPLERLVDAVGTRPIDVQPVIGLSLAAGDGATIEAHFEVKTRTSERVSRTRSALGDPISVYLTLRSYDPVGDVRELDAALLRLRDAGEALVEERVVPGLLAPLREAISAEGL